MSHCAMLSLSQATPLHCSALRCLPKETTFFSQNTGCHKFTAKTSTLRSSPFCAEVFFLHRRLARIKGIFITLLSDLTSHFFRHATVPSIDTAAVCEVTGDAELKSIFQTPPSLFSFMTLSQPPTSTCLFM